MAAMGFAIESLIVRVIGDVENLHKNLNKGEAHLKGFAASASAFAATASNAISAAMAAVGTVSVGAFASFDKAMTESTSIMKTTEEQEKRMAKAALELATQGNRGPAELAKTFYYLASASMDAEQSIAALPAVMKFAVAGAFDMAKATDLSVGALNALGLSVKDPEQNLKNMTRVMDVVARVSKISHGTTEQYAKALARDAAPTMRQYNVSLEEGASILAAYGKNNIKAELAGGTFARMLRLLAESSLRAGDNQEKMGFKVFDAAGNMRPIADIIENLEQVLGKLSPEARSAALKMMGFQVRAQNAILPLIGMSKSIREFRKEVNAAGGSIDTISERQMRAFSNQMARLKNVITVAAIEIGGMLAPALRAVGDALAGVVKWWRSLEDQTKKTILLTAGVFAAMGPLLGIFGLLKRAVVGIAFSRLIGEIAGYVLYLQQNSELVQAAWEGLKTAAVTAFEVVRAVIVVTARATEEFAGQVVDALSGANETFNQFVSDSISGVTNFVSANRDAIASFAGWSVVVLAGVAAFKLVTLAVGTTVAVMGALGITQAISTIATIAWTVAVFAAKVAAAVFAGVLAVLKMAYAAGIISTLAWGATVAAVTIAVTLLKVAVAALAIVVAGLVLAPVFVVVTAAIIAAWKAGNLLFSTLSRFTEISGPLSQVGAIFAEWGGILKQVFQVAQTDSKLAWELLQAGASLAFAQIKDMLPPLWTFIEKGFGILWEAVSASFKAHFTAIVEKAKLIPALMLGQKKAIDEAEKIMESADFAAKAAAGKAGTQLSILTGEFKIEEGDATKAARTAVQSVQDKIVEAQKDAEREQFFADLDKAFPELLGPVAASVVKVGEAANTAGQLVGKGMLPQLTKAKKEAESFDAVLAGSAEGQRRFATYREKVAMDVMGIGGGDKDSQLDVLKDIAKNTREIAEKDELDFEPADLE